MLFPFLLSLANEAEVSIHVEPLVAKRALVVFADGLHLALVDELRGLDGGYLFDFLQAVALQLPKSRGFGVLGQPLADVFGKGVHAVKPFPDPLGELVIQFRQLLFLDGNNFNMEVAFAGCGVFGDGFLWQGKSKFLFLSLGHAFYIDRKARHREVVIHLRDIVNTLVVDDVFSRNGATNIHCHQVTENHGTVGRFPGSAFVLQTLQYPGYVFVADFDFRWLESDGVEVAKIHSRLQRHHGLERHRLKIQDFQLRFRKGPDFVLPQNLVQRFRDHEFQSFLHQRGASQVAFHHGSGSLSGPEAGDAHAPGQPTVGTVQERFLVLGVH